MPTRISAGVSDHPCFFTFIPMIPIDCKLLNFPNICLFTLLYLKERSPDLLVRTSLLISGKFISHYASCSLIFNPLHCVINGEQHKKHLLNQSSHYRKYGMFNH